MIDSQEKHNNLHTASIFPFDFKQNPKSRRTVGIGPNNNSCRIAADRIQNNRTTSFLKRLSMPTRMTVSVAVIRTVYRTV